MKNRSSEYHELKTTENNKFGRRFSEDPDAIIGKITKSNFRDDMSSPEKESNLKQIVNDSDIMDSPDITVGKFPKNIVKRAFEKQNFYKEKTEVEKEEFLNEYGKIVEDVINSGIHNRNTPADIVKPITEKINLTKDIP